jgi:glycosyltransferase involved in cell wall biosynthesis
MKGNGYGYSNHTRQMKAALERLGVELSADAEIAVHIVVPTGFHPIPGKYNVLFTMYECATLPPKWISHVNEADLVVVPCEHNKRLFAQYTDLPIEVCQEGIEPERFQFYQRSAPTDRPFCFLWVGASNPRKGYEHIILAWQQWMERHPEESAKSCLIMKTTQITREERLVRASNVFVDTRDYSLENLITLYQFAHAFLFPTMGEGWGLTLHEAVATGLPAIYTPWSGVNDFMPRQYAYPLKFRMRTIRTMESLPDGTQRPYHSAPAASADVDHMVRRMLQVYHGYDRALEMGRKASEHVRGLTWDRAGIRLAEIIAKYSGQTVPGEGVAA